MTFQDTPQQLDIYDNVANGEGHTLVIARAGSGKTSSIERALKFLPEGSSALYLVYAKSNGVEAERRFGQQKNVFVATSHSFGLRCIRESLGNVRVDSDRTFKLSEGLVPGKMNRSVLCKAASLAKGHLLNPKSMPEAFRAFGIDMGASERRFCENVSALLERTSALDYEEPTVDFDDMIWWPNTQADISVPQYDYVFLDEVQDLVPAQHELALKAVRPGTGRLIAVGDDKQAIFWFRGADKNAIPNVVSKFNPTTLPLTVSFRCARAIIKEAQKYVPDIQAREDAPEGKVERITAEQMMSAVEYGDFILSRTNAPLVGTALRLANEGCAVKILGKRDFASQLISLLYKLRCSYASEVPAAAEAWAREQEQKLLRSERVQDEAVQLVYDKALCLAALARGARDIEEIVKGLRTLFVDKAEKNSVTLSTVHKAKGLERTRVFLLWDTFQVRGKNSNEDESRNLRYVGITRAREELYYVVGTN